MMVFAKGVFKGHRPEISNWDAPTMRKFNGKMVEGRPTKGYGVAEFKYAGKLYTPEPWTKDMKFLKDKAEAWASDILEHKIEFTFCLCGRYETGDISIPHHSDTVPTQKDYVLGISFGAPRVFEWNEYAYYIKKRTNTSKINILHGEKYLETTKHLVEEGDVYLFDGKSQMTSTHSIPALEGANERVNLTFRSGL